MISCSTYFAQHIRFECQQHSGLPRDGLALLANEERSFTCDFLNRDGHWRGVGGEYADTDERGYNAGVDRRWVLGAIFLMSGCTSAPELPEGASFDSATGAFVWAGGEVRLPVGLGYARIDSETFEGEFAAKSGRIRIHHDIGTTAGAWAQRLNSEFFEERVVDGARVWVAQRRRGGQGEPETLVAVTFPDNGCANFFAIAKEAMNRSVIEAVGASFRPKNTARDLTGRCEQRGM